MEGIQNTATFGGTSPLVPVHDDGGSGGTDLEDDRLLWSLYWIGEHGDDLLSAHARSIEELLMRHLRDATFPVPSRCRLSVPRTAPLSVLPLPPLSNVKRRRAAKYSYTHYTGKST